MKLAFGSSCVLALLLLSGAVSSVAAQIVSATPDPFVAQLTSSPFGNASNPFASFAGDITANGRFVVFESNANLDTQNPNNADGNRELFIIDYAQRRIFQLTNTKNVQKPPASPTPTPTPTPTPSASPTPTPETAADLSLVKIEISNNRPMISFEPALVDGKRIYTIVFTSNAPDPKNFDGADSAALVADGNQEIWVYQLPLIDDTFDLSSGDEIPATGLTGGTFHRITDTTPSRPLRTGINPPDVVDDNRDPTISDDGNTIAFISTRNLVPALGNADFNPELFLARTSGGFAVGTVTIAQGTATVDVGTKSAGHRFQQNPSLSANGNVVAFLSNANLAGANDDGFTDGHGNAEVYVANFTGSALSNIRQITKTKDDIGTDAGVTTNVLSAGRRLSRDGAYVAYESRAEDPAANAATNTAFLAVFVSTTADGVAKLAVPRALTGGDVLHFPAFTDYDSALAPHTLVFASALNFKADGTFPAAADDSTTGLNPTPTGTFRPNQIFSRPVPIATGDTFTRLTRNPILAFGIVGIRPLTSNLRQRIAFTLASVELGGGNADNSAEIFYLLTPTVNTESAAALLFFTGASNMGPFASASPTASPTPTPTPTPGDPAGLAPGELSIVRSTVALSTADKTAVGGSETARRPILPVELNGVSVAVNGSAAGLYFVGDTPAEGITFVAPVGLAAGVVPVVINNNGTTFHGFVQIVPSQPDIFTTTNAAGGNAIVCNVTNSAASGCIAGPFKVTSADSTGAQVPTKLEIWVTGLRLVLPAETKVSFVNGTTTIDVTPDAVTRNTKMFGYDLIDITLPATLAGTAPIDYKLIVTVTKSGTFTSRPAATAPQVTIIP